MKNKKTILPLTLGCILLAAISCSKEEDVVEPVVETPTTTALANTAPTAPVFNVAPANLATGISSPLTISWLASTDADGDAITYNVYLGTNSSSLTLVSSSQSSINYTTADLDLMSTYYLRIDATAGSHTTPSETRNFETSDVGSFTDPRDGHQYGIKKLGTQVWMTANLVYNSTGSYSYDNNASYDVVYGRLYDWLDVPNAVPAGWHLPTDTEWQTLETYLGMPSGDLNINGYSLSRGTDQGIQLQLGGGSGLNFPLAGYKSGSTFSAINNRTYLWVNTDAGGGNIFRRRIVGGDASCYRFTNPYAGYAISVRLVKD
ncbi:MAG: hypothetical protein COB15_01505 [Flavobacteriales bacterium]|nr:MAG: hypothetical protein COB15_01505 [Flavobacteriales bacterium]